MFHLHFQVILEALPLAASSDQECFVLESLLFCFTFSGDIRSIVIGYLLGPGMFCFRFSDWLLLSFDWFPNIVIYTDRQTGSNGMYSVDKNILLTLSPQFMTFPLVSWVRCGTCLYLCTLTYLVSAFLVCLCI